MASSKNNPYFFSISAAVVLQIKGYAETLWTDPEFDSEDQSGAESFKGHVDYLATKAYLHGSSSSIGVCSEMINFNKSRDKEIKAPFQR